MEQSAKVKHPLRPLPPGTAADELHRLHTDLLNSHLNFSPPSVDHHTAQAYELSSPHFDARGVAALPLGLGGHGFTPFSHPPPPPSTSNSSSTNPNSSDFTATHHHGAFYASWSASWCLIRAWVPLLRDENLPSLSEPLSPNSPPYKSQIRDAWLRINASSARLKLHPGRKFLPGHHPLPTYFDALLDGPYEPVPEMSYIPQTPSGLSSPNRPCLLIPPNHLNHQSPERVQSSISAIISGLAFCDLYHAASNSGKARLLDGASPLGPSTWLTRIPKSTRFRFLESGIDPISARAADLLACPPHLLHKHCLSCSYHTSPTLQPLGDDARHFVRCPKGLRLHSTVSDRVRDELAYILERCNIRIIAERQGSHRQMSSFMLREGSFLLKQPDIVIS